MTDFIDSVFGGTKRVFKVIVVFVVVVILGGVLGGVADVFAAGLIAGTPLGPKSTASPLAWTIIASVLLYAGMEVRD